jgi:hypothetical protein
MTALADAKALAPNPTAKAAVAVKGSEYLTLQNLLIGHANDMVILIKQMAQALRVRYRPVMGGEKSAHRACEAAGSSRSDSLSR